MTDDTNDKSTEILRITARLAAELRPHRPVGEVYLDSSIDRDLGFDSLGRFELISRIERAFNVTLPEQLAAGAETPRDLLQAVLAAARGRQQVHVTGERGVSPEKTAVPDRVSTLIELLDWHVLAHPDRTHVILDDEAGPQNEISYLALQQGAERFAAGLIRNGLEQGRSVAIMLPTGPDYFFTFFAVLLAGGVPVPIYPPARLSQIEDHLRRHAGILANAEATTLVTVPEARPFARLLKSQVAGACAIVTPKDLATASEPAHSRPAIGSKDTALLQYTSGSTGNPKGVVLTHTNLLANIRAMGQAVRVSSQDVFVSWLPLYHDMGLIGAWLGSLYFASPLVIMSPLSFLARPERWLWAIHKHRGTLSAAPNFAFELCLRKLDDAAIQGLDLSSWRLAFNGAEPVSPATMTEFAQRFAGYGLHPEAIAPVYGLAECSVGLAFPPPGQGLIVDRIKRDEFARSGSAVPAGADDPDPLSVVSCGRPLPGHQTRVVDQAGHELPERIEGRLEFKGPSASSGYYRNPDETRRLFHGEWLDTGDLAYQAEGNVYLTGRAKDIIIRAGRNIYPYELEEAVGSIAQIRKGCVAVFGTPDPASGTERLVVLAETRVTAPGEREELSKQIGTLTVDLLGLPPDDIVLAPPHTVLKTSSGKIRRAACRDFYRQSRGGGKPSPVQMQLLRLAYSGMKTQIRRTGILAKETLYAGYVWILFVAVAAIAWPAISLLPSAVWSWKVSRFAARLFLRMAGIEITVRGLANLQAGTPSVLVANHSSYLDGLIVIATLPWHISFVAKRELRENPIPRIYLKRLGTEFVSRFDIQQGAEEVKKLLSALHHGHSLFIFPEGTFRRMPGLLPFHMGAFLVAAQAEVQLIPVSICGTRSILHPDHWFPRRGGVTLTVGAPLREQESDWNAAIRLRDAARAEILGRCGEPDLEETIL